MRIIDKNHDYYDYMQDSTDRLVFDRRGSCNLTKETICFFVNYDRYYKSRYRFLVLQCGPKFWFILLDVVKDQFNIVKEFTAKLLATWTNYNKPNKLFQICSIELPHYSKYYDHDKQEYIIDAIEADTDDIIDNINKEVYNKRVLKIHGDFPIMKTSGLTEVVDSNLLFNAIEEYFSIEKQNMETTEPKGQTNNDKIEAHGFDLKTSFRGRLAYVK